MTHPDDKMSMDTRWPDITRTMRPWTRWWWLGSAVDEAEITRLLEEYRRAGLGGVEITPIYGVQGLEARDIPFLSPRWLEVLRHTLVEAHRLGMGVDMVTGTGWPFGGPNVTDEDAEDKLVLEKTPLPGGRVLEWMLSGSSPQALAAVSDRDETVQILGRVAPGGTVSWAGPPTTWTLYSVRQEWAGRRVKRAAPGGEGKCINPFSRSSLMHYLERFDEALRDLPPGAVRCQFHDSFEYLADWSSTLLADFEARRGYDLRDHLPALAGDAGAEESARVKTDYRETISDVLRENFTRTWTEWVHGKGSLSRNQAHGSPGNLLDLYGTADIPETEVFGGAGDPRASKFASSPAHVLGKPLVSSESCTWLGEHFTVSLAQAKASLDGLLLAGINHLFYHGTAYSPVGDAWPGRLFYASTTFAPQDPVWRDFPTLNTYLARCQSLLQSGSPDNDVLLYWPLHDLWQSRPEAFMLEINGRWLTEEPVGTTAQRLWDDGCAYDYISDRQLQRAQATGDGVQMPGGHYKAVVVPPCAFMPDDTLQILADLAGRGVPVIFEGGLPQDVPGLGDLPARRERFQAVLATATGFQTGPDLEPLLAEAGVRREGVQCIRRHHADGHTYFIVNTGQEPLGGWTALATPFRSAVLMEAMTGQTGVAAVRHSQGEPSEVFLQLPPGASVFVRTFADREADGPAWRHTEPAGEPVPLAGTWTVEFIDGGPDLPPPFQTDALGSWTDRGEAAERFSGTAHYALTFDAPPMAADGWRLDLGRVCESARVRLNGEPAGVLIAPPFQVEIGPFLPSGNVLEIEVTNLAANRIRDMDRRGQPWKVFREINFVDRHYKPFDASGWPVRDSGLLGPVRLVPMRSI